MKKTGRESNIELLRILAMLMIVGNHYAGHGIMYKWDPARSYQLWSAGSQVNKLFASLLSLGGEIGVGIFFIITGYFLSQSKQVHLRKFVLEVIWYGFLTTAAGILLLRLHAPIREFHFSFSTLVKGILIPITGGNWWFITAYFFLLLMIPTINSVIRKIGGGGRTYLFTFCLWIFWYVLGNFAMFDQLEKAVFFYMIGTCLRQRAESRSTVTKSAYPVIIVMIFAYLVGMVIRCHDAAIYVQGITGNQFSFSELSITAFVAPVCAIAWFKLFTSLKIGVRPRMNQIAATTFGVYLIHESAVGRSLLLYNLFQVDTVQYCSALFPVLAILSVVGIFAICSVIDLGRIKFIVPAQNHLCDKLVNLLKSNT